MRSRHLLQTLGREPTPEEIAPPIIALFFLNGLYKIPIAFLADNPNSPASPRLNIFFSKSGNLFPTMSIPHIISNFTSHSLPKEALLTLTIFAPIVW